MLLDQSPLQAYKQNSINAKIASASPQELVAMMLDHVLEQLDRIEGYLAAFQMDKKGDAISKCLEILHGLDSSLDMDNGGELAEQLHQLYDFCCRRLLEVNLRNQPEPLQEVRDVLKPLSHGWRHTT